MEEMCGKGWAEEKENENEEIKHGTKKGWTLDLVRSFSRIHMVVKLWRAPVWCWILTVRGSTSTRRSLCPTQHFTLLRGPSARPRKPDAGWREDKPVIFSRFVSLESPFPGETQACENDRIYSVNL